MDVTSYSRQIKNHSKQYFPEALTKQLHMVTVHFDQDPAI